MRLLLLLLALALAAGAAAPSTDPVIAARDYFKLISAGKLAEAYDLRSDAGKQSLSRKAFKEQWSNVLQMTATGFRLEEAVNLVDPAIVNFTMRTVEFDRATGKREEIDWTGNVTLVREAKVWWVEGVDLKKGLTLPYTGLELDPGQEVVKGPTPEPLPVDVPFYAGFKRSPPVLVRDARNPNGVRKVLSLDRQKNVAPSLIVDFYKQTMAASGWKAEPATTEGGTAIAFTKGDRRITVIIYKGFANTADSPPDPRGVRLEVRY